LSVNSCNTCHSWMTCCSDLTIVLSFLLSFCSI
jgi:hypothetical protein